jgi:hypothetical protein
LGGAQADVPVDVVFDDERRFDVLGEEPAEGVQVAEPGLCGAALQRRVVAGFEAVDVVVGPDGLVGDIDFEAGQLRGQLQRGAEG